MLEKDGVFLGVKIGEHSFAPDDLIDEINERIVKALDIASSNSQCVGKPYLLIDTQELKYNLIGGNE